MRWGSIDGAFCQKIEVGEVLDSTFLSSMRLAPRTAQV